MHMTLIVNSNITTAGIAGRGQGIRKPYPLPVGGKYQVTILQVTYICLPTAAGSHHRTDTFPDHMFISPYHGR